MGESLVALTYGKALFEAAESAGREAQVLEEVTCLAELMETEENLREFLISPAVTKEEKKAFTETALRGRISDEMVNFLFVLIDKNRVWYLSRIARVYRRCFDEAKNVAEGTVYSAVSMTEEQVETTAEAMSRLLGKRVELENEVDSRLLGGAKIQVDGKMIDRSLKGELALLLASLKH